MVSIVDSVRQQADKAAFEADKLIRIRREQAVIDQLRRDVKTQLDALGQTVLTVYRRREVDHPELTAIGQRIDALDGQIKQHEKTIEQIRAEQLTATPSQPTQPCPRCRKPVPAIATFCPHCGASIPKPAPGGTPCRNCGVLIPANAGFCPNCGAKKVAEPSPVRCVNCGAILTTGASFCPDCGTRVGQVVASVIPATMAPTSPAPSITVPAPPVPVAEGASVAETETVPGGSDMQSPTQDQTEPEPIAPAGPAGKACSNCQASLPQEAVFCPDCGTRLA
ncbi:MAG: zinc-ribbon domain-containing protein [Chloroflexi bacterium]|nr:zinc-ribbon domain-containing protein [Chloroflexota bacterium]